VPSVQAIRARLHVGQLRAQRVRAYLTALINAQEHAALDPVRSGRRRGVVGPDPSRLAVQLEASPRLTSPTSSADGCLSMAHYRG